MQSATECWATKMAQNISRAKSFPACGRLIVLQSMTADPLFGPSNDRSYDGYAAINFPSMPEVVELARRADYEVGVNPAFPDGIHQYRSTSVQEIPLSFRLHSFDHEYCPNGALTLLQIAAALESLVVPFGPSSVAVTVGPPPQAPLQLQNSNQPLPGQVGPPPPAPVTEQTTSGIAQNAATGSQTSFVGSVPSSAKYYPPATCYLELVITDQSSPGIMCVGYVKDVSVKLFGPFLRGPGISQNLPTRGEFGFTFVHHPGHTNSQTVTSTNTQQEQQAYAQVVQTRLFNTASLLSGASAGNWRGFSSD